MAITVDPLTYVITVPREDLDLVQTTPTEIRNMDLNWFRLSLADIMDDEFGMPLTKMFTHNTSVELGGLTYARIIEILEPYTVTFEDGQYAINLVGANSNVGDRVNVNQVSVRSQNSAGLISSPDIEYASFQNAVTIDVINGSSGTGYPVGTRREPSNNITDALLIAEFRGLRSIFLESDLSITESVDMTNFLIEGNNHVSTVLNIGSDAIVDKCKIVQCTIENCTLDDDIEISECIVKDIDYINGHIHDCGLVGNINLQGDKDTVFANCYTIDQDTPAIIDMGGTGNSIAMPNYSGVVWIKNLTDQTQEVGIGLNAGYVFLMDTITAGWIIVGGSGLLDDQTSGTAIVNTDGLMNRQLVAEGVWDEPIGNHLIAGTTGRSIGIAQFDGYVHIDTGTGLSGTVFPRGTEEIPVNNIADAVSIATANNIDKIKFHTHYTFASTDSIANLRLVGEGLQRTTLTFNNGCIMANCTLEHVTGTGDIIGATGFYDSLISDLNSATPIASTATIIVKDCILQGTTTFPVLFAGTLEVLNCWGMPLNGSPPIIDMGGANFDMDSRNYSGYLIVKNCTADDAGEVPDIRIMLSSGGLILDSSVTTGDFIVTGTGTVEDNSTSWTSLHTQGLMSQNTVAEAIWDEPIGDHLIAGTSGRSIGIQQYGGVVTIDITNGSSGTTFPVGTSRVPSNNIPDAIAIATDIGVKSFHVRGHLTAQGGPFTGYKVYGDNSTDTVITADNLDCQGVTFEDLKLTGTFINDSYITTWNCVVEDVTDIEIDAHRTSFGGFVRLIDGPEHKSVFYDCYDDIPGIGIPDIQVNGCESLGIWNFNGGIRLSTMTNPATVVSLMIAQGRLWVDETCVEGDIIVKGMADLRGTTGGTTIDQEGLITGNKIAEYVWDEPIADHLLPDTMGHQMYHQAYMGIVHIDTVNGVAGTDYPTGTTHQPCNNLADALIIASTHFMTTIHVVGSLEIDGEDITGRTIAADSSVGNSVTITSMVNTGTCYFQDITVSGALSGSTRFTTSVLGALTGFDGGAKNCLLTGDITITGSGANYFTECDTYVTGVVPKNISIGDNFLNLIKCRGDFQLSDYTGTGTITGDFIAGQVVVDSSCVSGMMVISGLVSLTDNSGAACVVIDGTITERGTANAVWTNKLVDHTEAGTFGGEIATKADIASSTATTQTYHTTALAVAGTEVDGDESSVLVKDSNYWQIQEDGVDGLTVDFTFFIPTDNKPGVFEVFGRYSGQPSSTHFMDLQFYNFEQLAWENAVTEFMPGGNTSDSTYSHEYYERHIDRTNNNEVRARIIHNPTNYSGSHNLHLDYVDLSSVEVKTVTDYADAVWSYERTP